ncbi:MAG: hypothetical protein L0154_09740 [Chloroflexi bacterium]|nr:hypothetical protein [Chloroflexota bacterium]
MLNEHPLMKFLDFTYSSFGQPRVQDDKLIIPVREFSVTKDFPGFQFDTIFEDGFLVLEGVQSSKRTIAEYATPEGNEFKPSYSVEDGPFLSSPKEPSLFDLSGPGYDPHGWVEWIIIAENIRVVGGEIIKVGDN